MVVALALACAVLGSGVLARGESEPVDGEAGAFERLKTIDEEVARASGGDDEAEASAVGADGDGDDDRPVERESDEEEGVGGEVSDAGEDHEVPATAPPDPGESADDGRSTPSAPRPSRGVPERAPPDDEE